MNSKTTSIAPFLSLNILIVALILASHTCPTTSSPPSPYYPTPTPTPIIPETPPSGPGTDTPTNCPRNALNLGVCANVLNGLLGLTVGTQPAQPCCSLIQGLVELQAAACLCTALQANILGANLNVPLSVSLLLNLCGLQGPSPGSFQCA